MKPSDWRLELRDKVWHDLSWQAPPGAPKLNLAHQELLLLLHLTGQPRPVRLAVVSDEGCEPFAHCAEQWLTPSPGLNWFPIKVEALRVLRGTPDYSAVNKLLLGGEGERTSVDVQLLDAQGRTLLGGQITGAPVVPARATQAPPAPEATSPRSLRFRGQPGARYWWHWSERTAYVPPLFSFLTEPEWQVMEGWFEDTTARQMVGEVNIPLMSVLQGLLMGSATTPVVQLGHYAGYSTLLIGWMLRRMGHRRAFVSIDIDPVTCDYTQRWIQRAELGEHVTIHCGSSTDPASLERTRRLLGQPPRLVFIDASHEYGQTLKELDTWYEVIAPGGLILLHDTSPLAERFDRTGEGGVRRAVSEWLARQPSARAINIFHPASQRLLAAYKTLDDVAGFRDELDGMIYKDFAGLGIIQKG